MEADDRIIRVERWIGELGVALFGLGQRILP